MVIYSEGKIIWTKDQQKRKYFKFICWLSFQIWWQKLLIPYHIIAGYYYGYSTSEIYNFILKIILNKNDNA